VALAACPNQPCISLQTPQLLSALVAAAQRRATVTPHQGRHPRLALRLVTHLLRVEVLGVAVKTLGGRTRQAKEVLAGVDSADKTEARTARLVLRQWLPAFRGLLEVMGLLLEVHNKVVQQAAAVKQQLAQTVSTPQLAAPAALAMTYQLSLADQLCLNLAVVAVVVAPQGALAVRRSVVLAAQPQ
jgi:hypothetical protein